MIGAILQARTGSSRYPSKIYEDLSGKYTLQRVLEGVKSSKMLHKIILAMPEYDKTGLDHRLIAGELTPYIDKRFNTYFGHPDDLLDRYFQSAQENGIDLIVRITCDCPLIQGKIVDEMLITYLKNNYNGFMGNNELVCSNPYPDGADIEIFPYWMLAEAHNSTRDPVHREHVTPYMYRVESPYNIYEFKNQRPNSKVSMKHPDFSFDTVEDYKLLLEITKHYDEFAKKHDSVTALNMAIKAV